MPTLHETAYPRIKSTLADNDLQTVYTPTPEDVAFAEQVTRLPATKVGLLALLKTFQRLGYFLPFAQIPRRILTHVSTGLGFVSFPADLEPYDIPSTLYRHQSLIRDYLGVTVYGPAARRAALTAGMEAARTKEDLADIINVMIEALVHQRFELPAFNTLERIAFTARRFVNQRYQHTIAERLGPAVQARLDTLFLRAAETPQSVWERAKREPKSPTVTHMQEFLAHLQWLRTWDMPASIFADLPAVKRQQWAAEAQALPAYEMRRLRWRKRYALAAALLRRQVAKALDELTEMFLRRMHKLHQAGEEALEEYRKQHQGQMDQLIQLLYDITQVVMQEHAPDSGWAAVGKLFAPDPATILAQCAAHRAYAGNNYFAFLPAYYRSHRSVFFHFLESVPLKSSSQDRSVEEAIAFVLTHRQSKGPWLENTNPLSVAWIPDKWWSLVTGRTRRAASVPKVDKRYFELCLFSQIWLELKSGDLYVEGSDAFSDYRAQLVSPEEYAQGVEEYGEQVGLPVEGKTFGASLRAWLENLATTTDASFPANTAARLEDGKMILSKLQRKPLPADFPRVQALLRERLPEQNILDILHETDHWLHWTRHFGPLSGFEPKFPQPRERYLATTFCYGCNLGPTQLARSLPGLDRKQIAWVYQRHVSEAKLDAAIVALVNAYNQFTLPQFWGSGDHVAADGMKWDVYEQNLLAEYHLRYGSWGGVGYYHVSEKYIALFSRFIPCGVWEGVYILDGLLTNASEIQPSIVHADTQGQSTAIFGLAHLLGIQLMPRIRNWKELTLFRPSRTVRYQHLDQLFGDPINWRLIEIMWPDLLRIGMSVKAGKLTPSTILRRLGTYSRKNRVYLALRELGRAIRTGFLLQYLSDAELRRLILRSLNKSELFNGFLRWVFFGGEGVITENRRDEQRKIIKYNHLVANLVIFHNVVMMTKVLRQLLAEGHAISAEALAVLSPYLTAHINRLGLYSLQFDQEPEPIDYELPLVVVRHPALLTDASL
jgi:TnpA family transposase